MEYHIDSMVIVVQKYGYPMLDHTTIIKTRSVKKFKENASIAEQSRFRGRLPTSQQHQFVSYSHNRSFKFTVSFPLPPCSVFVRSKSFNLIILIQYTQPCRTPQEPSIAAMLPETSSLLRLEVLRVVILVNPSTQ